MNKLPLTNIKKFKVIRFWDGVFDTPFRFSEYFYIEGFDGNRLTLHGNYVKFEQVEGILIKWKDNPFHISHINDNYLILTDKRNKK